MPTKWNFSKKCLGRSFQIFMKNKLYKQTYFWEIIKCGN